MGVGGRGQIHHVSPKEVVSDLSLDIPIDEVTLHEQMNGQRKRGWKYADNFKGHLGPGMKK